MYLHKIKLSLCAALLVATLGGCKDSDQPDPSRHVSKAEAKEMTSFDRWLKENYTDAYNVSLSIPWMISRPTAHATSRLPSSRTA